MLDFFFPTCKFGISKGLLPKPHFVVHAVENGCVYTSSRVEGVSGAVGLKPCVHFYLFYFFFVKFLKCYLWEGKEERLT